MGGKLEFGSEAWLALAGRVLAEATVRAGGAIAGQRLCISETFAGAPAHLCGPGADAVAWSFRIADGQAEVIRGAAPDADYAVRADYAQTLPGARAILGTTPEAIEARNAARREAVASGRIHATGSLDDVSPALRQVLLELHNRLAEATL